jgi:arylsulfatase A-like enzyme
MRTWSFAAALFWCGAMAWGADKPNVVLMLTDNQSYFELSCHGHKTIQTPRIDALAKQSVDFVNFHAPPYCSPSRGLLMTGRYAMRSGIHNTIGGRSILHKDEVTIADRLRKAGYRTGVFGKWHLGFSFPYMPRHRGFDVSFVHGGGGIGQMEDYFGNSHIDATYWRNGKTEPSKGFSSDILFNEGLKFIEANKDRPFFAFISTPATHSPWQSHPGALKKLKARGVTKGPLSLYSMVENIDQNVGRVLDKLDALKLTEKTIVIFASDQGMTDRGAPESRVKGRRKSDRDGYDERHHVFCMIKYPPLTQRPHQSTAIVGMVDMVPTLVDLAGIGKVDGLDGRSLRLLLAGAEKWEDDRELIVQCPRGRNRKKWGNAAVKTQRWRLVGGDRLYDIAVDRGESTNVAADHPDVVKRLTASYEKFWASLPSEKDTLPRHIIGANPTRLNGMDWYQGASPWNKGAFRGKSSGVWAVDVEQDGKYRFELRHYPREANKPHGATGAVVRVGDVEAIGKISPDHAVVEISLKKGNHDLTATLGDGKKKWGALFVYISRIGD